MAESNQIAKRYSNYTLTIFAALLIAMPLGIILLLFGHLAFDAIPWILNLLFPLFLGTQFLSGIRYTGRIADFLTNDTTFFDICKENIKKLVLKQTYQDLWKRVSENHKFEFLGLMLGLTLAITLTVVQAIFHVPNLFTAYQNLGIIFNLIGNLSVFCGLCNRAGRTLDFAMDENKKETNYTIGILCGLAVGIILTVTILSVVGVSTVASMGSALPAWLAIGVFSAATIGSCTSAGSYIGRFFDAFFGNRSLIGVLFSQSTDGDTLKDRFKESKHILTVVGCTLGLLLAIGLVAGGITSIPFFGSGLPPVFAGILLFSFCISALGTLGNCIGDGMDKAMRKDQPELPEMIVQQEPSPASNTLEAAATFAKDPLAWKKNSKNKTGESNHKFLFWCTFSGSDLNEREEELEQPRKCLNALI